MPDTGNIVQSLVDNSHTFNEAVQNVGNFLAETAHQYGPQAADMVLAVVRINAISQILLGFLLVGMIVVDYLVVMSVYRKMLVYKSDRPHADVDLYLLAIVLLCAAGFFLFIGTTMCLFDTWTWVAVFDPKLGLAGKIITKFL